MTPNEAFKFVLDTYDIKPQQLADESGVNKSIISKFVNGRSDIHATNLQKIVLALPPEARTHFNMLFSFSNNKIAKKANKSKV